MCPVFMDNKEELFAHGRLFYRNGWRRCFKRVDKNHTKRVRPENHLLETGGYSFPSGHAMLGLIFFSMVAYFILKEVKGNSLKWVMGIGFVCLVLLIGISRIAMNVHFPTDILAGYALGAAYSLTLINLYKCVRWRSIYKKT